MLRNVNDVVNPVCFSIELSVVPLLMPAVLTLLFFGFSTPLYPDLVTELIGGRTSSGKGVVVPFHVPEMYRSLPFCEAAYHMYNEFGITMLGLNATIDESSGGSGGGTEVPVLNPSHRMIVGNSCCFGICPDWKNAWAATNKVEEKEEEFGSSGGGVPKTTMTRMKNKRARKKNQNQNHPGPDQCPLMRRNCCCPKNCWHPRTLRVLCTDLEEEVRRGKGT